MCWKGIVDKEGGVVRDVVHPRVACEKEGS